MPELHAIKPASLRDGLTLRKASSLDYKGSTTGSFVGNPGSFDGLSRTSTDEALQISATVRMSATPSDQPRSMRRVLCFPLSLPSFRRDATIVRDRRSRVCTVCWAELA